MRLFLALASSLVACGGERSATSEPQPPPGQLRGPTEEGPPDPPEPDSPTTDLELALPTPRIRVHLVEVALPSTAAPFPGYAGADRCTLVTPLPFSALRLAGPILQCEMARYLSVHTDGAVRPASVRLGGASPPPAILHAAVHGSHRDVRAWLGRTLLRGSARGLERWVPDAPPVSAQAPVFEPLASLQGAPVVHLVGGPTEAWALTDDAIWRVSGEGAAARATRFFALSDLPLEGAGPATGDFCRVAPIDPGRVLLRFGNYGRNDLFVVEGEGARPLAVPEAAPRPPPAPAPRGEPVPTGAPPRGPRGGGPSGGVTPPRMHEPLRVGGRVFVGSADDRLLVFDAEREALVDVSPAEGLRRYATRDLQVGRADAAPGPDGLALVALESRLLACEAGRCATLDTPHERTYAHITHMSERTFLALHGGGATVVTIPE